MTTVREITGWLEDAYPPHFAEDWDRVGLDVGDLDAEVGCVGFALDPTAATIAEAQERGAQLLVTHHPLLLRGINAVRADQPKGRMIMALLGAGIAHFAAHTNADHARDGVSDALAAALGLRDTWPLQPLGHLASEGVGTGRVGVLEEPLTARELAARLAAATPTTAGGVRLGGDPQRQVRTIALVGGAGDAFLDAARAAGVDAYITSDLRHHPAQDFLAWEDAPVLIDVAHAAAEALWLPRAEQVVRERAGTAGIELTTYVSQLNSDPWTIRL